MIAIFSTSKQLAIISIKCIRVGSHSKVLNQLQHVLIFWKGRSSYRFCAVLPKMENDANMCVGGASGIGLQIGIEVLKRGGALAICDIQESSLSNAERTLREAGGPTAKIITARVDVTIRQEVENYIERIVSELGGLHAAFNFAGVVDSHMGTRNIEDQEDDQYQLVIDVNMTGVFNCMRAELKYMTAGATVVNASSAAGLIGFAGGSAYTASKHAVAGLTRAVAKEAGARNIRINAVAP